MIRYRKYFIRKELCKKCMVCQKVCPQEAVIKKIDNTMEIDQDKCNGCGLCKEQCKLRVITKKFGIRFYSKR